MSQQSTDEMCEIEHGDWTGRHRRISSCPPASLSHRFNWQEESEGSFLKWMMVHFGSHMSAKEDWAAPDGVYARMDEATNNFMDVELRILVSGVEVDAGAFIARLDKAVDYAVERGVAEKIAGDMPMLGELYQTLSDFEREMKKRVIQYAVQHGIEFREDDWR